MAKRIGQGRENVKKYLKENPDVLDEIEGKVEKILLRLFEQSLGEDLPSKEEDDE